jgi:hypothetical protein
MTGTPCVIGEVTLLRAIEARDEVLRKDRVQHLDHLGRADGRRLDLHELPRNAEDGAVFGLKVYVRRTGGDGLCKQRVEIKHGGLFFLKICAPF